MSPPAVYVTNQAAPLPGRCPKCDARVALWMIDGSWHWGAPESPWYPHACLKSHVRPLPIPKPPKPNEEEAARERVRLYRDAVAEDAPDVHGRDRHDLVGAYWDDPTFDAATK